MNYLNSLRSILKAGKTSIGSWLQINSADVAELMAQAGYDWIVVDMEHGAFSSTDLPAIFRAIECGGAIPFVRLREVAKAPIKSALDAGAKGLIFPHIESYEQLDFAIKQASYPHHGGERGFGYCRANTYGKHFENYSTNLAYNIFFVAQIEHINAVNNLEKILSHTKLDAIMVGPYDLSGSMNIVGDFDNLEFASVMKQIESLCKSKNIPMGIHIAKPDPQALAKYVNDGYTFIAYGIDSVFLWQGATKPTVR